LPQRYDTTRHPGLRRPSPHSGREIISLYGGRIFVGGDIDDCTYGYYSTNRHDSDVHLRKVAWMGRCQDIDYYVAQKAQIGMTDGGKLVWTWDNDVARYDLYQLAQEEDYDEETREAILDIITYVDDGEYAVWERLYQCLDDPYDAAPKLGRRLSGRVVYTWAAMRRLCEILLGPNPADPRGDLCP
jgi:hypothetical protein